jgi:hypothetical protein
MPSGQRAITDFLKLRPELAALAQSSYAPDRGMLWTHGVSLLRLGVRSVAIHPAGVEMTSRIVNGSRWDAELKAHALIDSWLKRLDRRAIKRRLQVAEQA